MRRMTIGALGLVLALLCAACGGWSTLSEVGKAVGVELSDGEVLTDEDTHGGFHGDGRRLVTVRFPERQGDTLAETISGRDSWSPLPLPGVLSDLAKQGFEDLTAATRGYYFFENRHSEAKDGGDLDQLVGPASFNFTVAVYDTAARTLYYYELDT